MTELPPDFGARDASLRATETATGETPDLFSPGQVFARIAARVPDTLAAEALDRTVLPRTGDHSLNGWAVAPETLASARVAAVLIGLVERGGVLHVLLTQRTATLRDHSGQIAFPGGKMDPGDPSPAATAVREAQEEVGIPPDRIAVLGYLGAYLTGSGFRIVPVIARLLPPFETVPNPGEVADTFEVPFAFLMSEANHQLREREWKGIPRQFYAIPYGERNIWGITAGILRALHERLYR